MMPRRARPARRPRRTPSSIRGPTDFFTGNFNFRDHREGDLGPAEWLRWARLRGSTAVHPHGRADGRSAMRCRPPPSS